MIRSFNTEEYRLFMESFEDGSRSSREYFTRLRFYSEIGSKVEILKNLDVITGELITDSHVIGRLVTGKYNELFKDVGKKVTYPYGVIVKISIEDVEYAMIRPYLGT